MFFILALLHDEKRSCVVPVYVSITSFFFLTIPYNGTTFANQRYAAYLYLNVKNNNFQVFGIGTFVFTVPHLCVCVRARVCVCACARTCACVFEFNLYTYIQICFTGVSIHMDFSSVRDITYLSYRYHTNTLSITNYLHKLPVYIRDQRIAVRIVL